MKNNSELPRRLNQEEAEAEAEKIQKILSRRRVIKPRTRDYEEAHRKLGFRQPLKKNENTFK